MDKELCLTPAEAAKLKGVSRTAIYDAIKDGRLPHTRILNRIGLKKSDVEKWKPIRYAGREGVKGGRPKGIPMSDEAKKKISEGQKVRWKKVNEHQSDF